MKITYNLNQKDYVDFNIYHIQYVEETKKKLNTQRILGTGSLVLLGVISMVFGQAKQIFIPVLIVGMAIIWYKQFPDMAKTRIKKSTEKAMKKGELKDIFSEVTVEFTDNGISEVTKHGKNLIKWDGIREVVYLPEYIFLFFNDNGAMIVPYRVMELEEVNEIKAIIERNNTAPLNKINESLS